MNEQAQLNDSREGSADNANPERNGDSFSGGRTSQADSFEEIARLAATFKAMNRPSIPPELAATFKAMNRPSIPPELAATFEAMNRPSIPPELAATFKAMNRPSIPPELAATFKAMNRPSIPPELAATFEAMNRPSIPPELAATFKAMNRPSIPPELAATFEAMNRPSIPPELAATFEAMNRPSIPPELAATFEAMNRPSIPPELAATFKAMNRPSIPPELAKSLASTGLRPRTPPATQSGKPLAIQKAGLRDVDGRSMRRHEEPRFWSDSEAVLADNVSFTEETCYWLIPFDALVTDDGLRQTCRSLFNGDHYALAVQKAFTYIDNMVRDKSGQAEKYGADLMRTVFSAKSPVLRLNDLETLSDRNEQQGYMEMLAGAMIGIRNPRSHEYDFVDRPEEALEMLVMANHFIRMLNKATPT